VWLITITSLCIAYNFGLLSVFIFFGLTLIYYCLLLFGNQVSIWITSLLLLGVGSYNDSLFVSEGVKNVNYAIYRLIIIIVWF